MGCDCCLSCSIASLSPVSKRRRTERWKCGRGKGRREGFARTMGKLTTALLPRICRAAVSYARAASSAESNVPSQSLQPRVGSRISAANLPHGRCRTPRNLVVPFLFEAETLSIDCDLRLPPWLPPPPLAAWLVPADTRRRAAPLGRQGWSSDIRRFKQI